MLCARVRAEPSAEYETTIRAALQEYKAGNWNEATMLFLRAHSLAPSARTHRGLGLCYFEARAYVQAMRHLQAALDDRRRPLPEEQRHSTEAALARARAMVGEVVVHSVPEDASVLVDGRSWDRASGPLLLDAGAHTFEFIKPGHVPQHRTVDVEGEHKAEIAVELEASSPAALPARAAESDTPDDSRSVRADADRSSGRNLLGPVIVLATGGAALAGALVTGLMESAREQKLVGAGCEMSCAASYEPTRRSARTLQVASNVMLAAGSAAVVGGTLWLLLGRGGAHDGTARAAALCAPGACVGVVRGQF